MHASRTFEPSPDHVADARRFVVGVLHSRGLDVADAQLAVSELATNAVLHARSAFTVTVTGLAERIRVDVSDHNPRLPSLVAVPSDAHSGRGLMLVQMVSLAWGVESHGEDGKTIWFEVPSQPEKESPTH
jgi:anti-sigma regulatory factor (Ser/Thr protein kinase)